MNENNIKYYSLWIFCNTLYLTEFTFFINRYEHSLAKCICWGIVFQLAYYIVFAWVESFVRLICWKIKKYKMLIIRLFPICIEFSAEKMHICFDKGIFEFGNIYTFPKITLENYDKVNEDSIKIVQICKKANMLWIMVTIIIACVMNFYMGIFMITLGVATIVFLHIESDIMFTGGRYSAIKKGKIVCENYYSIVLNDIDVSSKACIYREFCKEIVTYDEQTTRERRAMEGVIIDSIYDGYDYMTDEGNEVLMNVFRKKDLKNQAIYNRLFFLYRTYCEMFHQEKIREVNERFDEYLEELLRQASTFPARKIAKLLDNDYQEIMDYRNNSELYRKKLEMMKCCKKY